MKIEDITEDMAELLAQQDIINEKIALKKAASAPAELAKCIKIIKEFGFTAAQLELKKNKRRVVHLDESFEKDGVKYGGRGPAPAWIKSLKAEHTENKKINADSYKEALEAFRVSRAYAICAI